MCVYTYVHGVGRGAAPVIAVDKSRTAERRELLFRKHGNQGGIPPCSLPLFVKAVLLINLGVLDCSSSESERFYRLINLWTPTAGSLRMPLLVVSCPV